MRTWYREQKYICGDNFIDIQIFPVYPPAKGRRGKRKPTTEIQARLNEENAKKKYIRLIHSNFKNKDYELTLTYDEDSRPESEEEAKKDIQRFFRRVRTIYKKLGIEFKYIWTMERSSTGKIHFHIFMSGGADRTELEDIWKKGYANTKSLKFSKNGVAGLAHYTLKDKPLTYRRWSGSKNLKKPEMPRSNDYRITKTKARKLYEIYERYEEFESEYPEYKKFLKDYSVAEVKAMHNQINYEYYFSIRLYRTNFLKE